MAMGGYDSPTFIDRPRLAMENLIRGDVRGSVQAVTDPEQLSPYQMGLTDTEGEWKPKGNTVMTQVLNTVTNPLLLVGLVLASKWPIAKAASLIKWTKKAEEMSALPMIAAKAMPFGRIFDGMAVKGHTFDFLQLAKDTREELRTPWVEAVLGWEKGAKRSLKYQDEVLTALKMDVLTDSTKAEWGLMRSLSRVQKYRKKYGLQSVSEVQTFIDTYGVDEMLEAKVARGGVWTNLDAFHRDVPDQLFKGGRATTDKTIAKMLETGEALEEHKAAVTAKIDMLESHGFRFTKAQRDAVLDGSFGVKDSGYFPHQLVRGAEGEEKYLADIVGTRAEKKGLRKETSHLIPSKGGMIPNLRDLKVAEKYMTPETAEMIRDVEEARRDGLFKQFPEYSLRSAEVLDRYTLSMAKSHSLLGVPVEYEGAKRPYYQIFDQELKGLRDREPGGKSRAQLFSDTYLPIIVGNMDGSEAQYALEWGHYKHAAHSFLTSPKASWVPERMRTFLTGQLERSEIQGLTYKNAGAKIANWFYASTLGGNLVSPVLNMTQNLMGLSGLAEAEYIAKGMTSATRQMTKFAKLRMDGVAAEQALDLAIPNHRLLFEGFEDEYLDFMQRIKYGDPGPVRGGYRKMVDFLMKPFTLTERWNKLGSFETGRIKALAEGLDDVSSLKVGKEFVYKSAYPGGPFGTPAALVNTWAPFRQFMQFPLRTLSLATENPGVAGRMMVSGVALTGLGRMAGLDLSRGTVFGALPTPYSEDQPFFPFPVVPPAVSVAGSVASDVFTGKLEKIPRSLPLLVPGGIGLSRLAGVVSPEAAKFIGRPYADYNQVRPDGTVPSYSSEGNLVGFKRPVDLFNEAVGWTSFNGQNVGDLERYLVKQRDKIRGVRRNYVEAMASNDFRQAEVIQEQWKKEYPGMGDIAVKPQDIQAVHLRHDVSRVERILQTLPEESRQQYGDLLRFSMGEAAGAFTGVDPALLTGGSVRGRDASRMVPAGAATQAIRSGVPGLHPRAVLGEAGSPMGGGGIRQDELGSQPKQSGPFGNFEAFADFNRRFK